MKIKIKDEMNKYKITLTHRELTIIREALDVFDTSEVDYDEYNQHLFDKDEYECNEELDDAVSKVTETITDTLSKVDVY